MAGALRRLLFAILLAAVAARAPGPFGGQAASDPTQAKDTKMPIDDAANDWNVEPDEEMDPEFLQTGEAMMDNGETQELQCTCDKMKCNCMKKCECSVPAT